MQPDRNAGTETLYLSDAGAVPNNPRLPVLLHRRAVPAGRPEAAEALFRRNGWEPAWRNGIYPYHHYHANAHEALAIVEGRVRVRLGGEPGVELDLKAGDVVVLPAGTGHRNLGDSGGLLVVGAYPPGQEPDMHRDSPNERDETVPAIAAVPNPPTDPVTGQAYPAGPV